MGQWFYSGDQRGLGARGGTNWIVRDQSRPSRMFLVGCLGERTCHDDREGRDPRTAVVAQLVKQARTYDCEVTPVEFDRHRTTANACLFAFWYPQNADLRQSIAP